MRARTAALSVWAILAAASGAAAEMSTSGYYRLLPSSTFERGCFPPCACPSGGQLPIAGTFVLTPVPGPASFDLYQVTGIDWTVQSGDTTLHLTGSGTYRRRTLGEPTHQLELDLKDDTGQAEHFDSKEVPGGAEFPRIHITISIHGGFCFDTVIEMAAELIQPATPYRLSSSSNWQRGCFGICDCILRGAYPVTGTFTLRLQEANPLYATYAVEKIDWLVKDELGPHHITGAGVYTLGGEVAIVQRLVLDLQTDGEPAEHFDSGQVTGGAGFPVIDISININGLVCFDTLIAVQAGPAGDFNLDSRVDKEDLAWFVDCAGYPGVLISHPACEAADLDDDGDADQSDFGVLQRCITGALPQTDAACMD